MPKMREIKSIEQLMDEPIKNLPDKPDYKPGSVPCQWKTCTFPDCNCKDFVDSKDFYDGFNKHRRF